MKNPFKLFGPPGDEPAPPPLPPLSSASHDPAGAPARAVIPREIPRALATMVTHAWKAKQRLQPRPPETELGDEQRRLLRHLDAILDEAGSLGITIKDRTHEAFDYGLPEKVVASEPQAGLTRPVVRETLRPTISWHDHILVHGEVILAVPAESLTPAAAHS